MLSFSSELIFAKESKSSFQVTVVVLPYKTKDREGKIHSPCEVIIRPGQKMQTLDHIDPNCKSAQISSKKED